MEGTGKASKFEREDFISNHMPDDEVTNIMDRLPLRDAVRTGILSRDWRFKWAMLTQLVFDMGFILDLSDIVAEADLARIICMFLLRLKGVITKFVLCIDESCYPKHVAEISHWIFFLSTKGIKDLALMKCFGTPFKLPTHVFSCLELRRLLLANCCFDPPLSFHGFPNLWILELIKCQFESGKFSEFLTHCPVLEILNIDSSTGKVKLADIAKLSNLKALSLSLCNIDDSLIISSSSIIELVGSLPKLQELGLRFSDCKLTEVVAEKRFSTTFPNIKTLNLSEIDLGSGIKLSYAFQMIRSFPNLRTLGITSNDLVYDPTHAYCSPDVDYYTMELMLKIV